MFPRVKRCVTTASKFCSEISAWKILLEGELFDVNDLLHNLYIIPNKLVDCCFSEAFLI